MYLYMYVYKYVSMYVLHDSNKKEGVLTYTAFTDCYF
jgi:hypothetical protein